MEIFTFIHSDRVAMTVCTELTPKKGNGKRVGDISGKFFFCGASKCFSFRPAPVVRWISARSICADDRERIVWPGPAHWWTENKPKAFTCQASRFEIDSCGEVIGSQNSEMRPWRWPSLWIKLHWPCNGYHSFERWLRLPRQWPKWRSLLFLAPDNIMITMWRIVWLMWHDQGWPVCTHFPLLPELVMTGWWVEFIASHVLISNSSLRMKLKIISHFSGEFPSLTAKVPVQTGFAFRRSIMSEILWKAPHLDKWPCDEQQS